MSEISPKHLERPLAGHPIGVVSKLTGIQPTTLRIWERRYNVVQPDRSNGRNRLYSTEDIRRLGLIKTLVDAGHPISVVAPLTDDQLQARLESTSIQSLGSRSGRQRACPAVILGSALPARLKDNEALEIVAAYSDEAALREAGITHPARILIVEYPTVHSDATARVRSLLAACGASHAVVIYGFGSRQALEDLAVAGIVCLRAPADIADIVSASRQAQAPLGRALVGRATTAAGEEVPPPRFTPEQLARISALAPTIACECPHHLVDLINSMAAFEAYSRECENKNTQDAQIHAYLHETAGRSRAMLEAALEKVAEFEGIALN
ncbi:MAG TPA: MerR family transcriptional regulator [Burkholderiales bacterium]|nr:MerR family transcriptional regulator [Burkholderiales bacterium]